jgi:hypothetical protein
MKGEKSRNTSPMFGQSAEPFSVPWLVQIKVRLARSKRAEILLGKNLGTVRQPKRAVKLNLHAQRLPLL